MLMIEGLHILKNSITESEERELLAMAKGWGFGGRIDKEIEINQKMAFGRGDIPIRLLEILEEKVTEHFMGGAQAKSGRSKEEGVFCSCRRLNDSISTSSPSSPATTSSTSSSLKGKKKLNPFPLPVKFDQMIANYYDPFFSPLGFGIVDHVDLLDRFGDGILVLNLMGTCNMTFTKLSSSSSSLPSSTSVLGSAYNTSDVEQESCTSTLGFASADNSSNVKAGDSPVKLTSILPPNQRKYIFLEARDILLLSGEARYSWTHGIKEGLEDLVPIDQITQVREGDVLNGGEDSLKVEVKNESSSSGNGNGKRSSLVVEGGSQEGQERQGGQGGPGKRRKRDAETKTDTGPAVEKPVVVVRRTPRISITLRNLLLDEDGAIVFG